MKILVTGGCGMIGSHVATYYHDRGHEVVVMDNLERSALLGHTVSPQRQRYNFNRLKDKVPIFKLDVSKQESWDSVDMIHGRFDAVFHMAAQCGVPTSVANPVRDFEVNALGTLNMLEAARKWDSKVVYASTNKVYPIHGGWELEGERWRWIKESRHKKGWSVGDMNSLYCSGTRTPYGTSKYAGDLYCQEYAGLYDMSIGVFRMSCIYGEHQMGFEEQGWATWFAIALEKGLPITVYGDGCQVRDMLHVSDVVGAYDAFLNNKDWKFESGVWNLGGGPNKTLSVRECIRTLEVLRGKQFVDVKYEDWRASDQRVYTSSIHRLKKDLGWEPTIHPTEGLAGIVDWVREVADVF